MEVTYEPLDDDGMPFEYGTPRPKKKQDRSPTHELDHLLLQAYRRNRFSSERDKKRWHKICAIANDEKDPHAQLRREWIIGLIAWGTEAKSKPIPMQNVMKALENNERWLDYIDKNSDRIVDAEAEKQVEETISILEADAGEFE